ncbi:MAG: class C beta-lactamase-related serine hydrolase [Mesorhizobium sp.]|uniref:serine hydrolase domain-containing protein n=1 Tax=Mesorhizobium sp. TaxID=1871066 RepID=UPI000FE878D0|nr:serine hydrolase [Mesorhizobium sp.]RWA95931.1 MAG: class C beta-lactamase-related serine hydrolase [Mesorhizobium sp.]RWK56777.1 MAG: class C beta-lactamase-related serine hydrolase [Mesorhizobium sp.]RWM40542.1 MAG: class C beta-lactamase-related serine hydrolase [Mesorhizobium sp.]RWM44089.1 MAG: class C beta-lactamase-related serine hydrolase [Mesorhizobium sp.]RWO21548.1 MAG: class C beta-lactamase-related serine hydrolase [Mesorhizobium sp.]
MLEFEGQRYLDGRASDPRVLGWMCGAPPPEDKRITFESDAFFEHPQNRWSLSHMRELAPTVNVWRGRGTPSQFERSDMSTEIDALSFTDMEGRICRFDEALFDTYADGIVVLHRGRVVYERYFGALQPHLPHLCYSVTKSYAGTLAAAFVHEGVLDDSKMIPHYLPELRGTGWEDATLRQVMDMHTGLAHREEYATGDRSSDVWAYRIASGRRPRPAGYDGPQTACDYLRTVRKEGAHGEVFAYKTVNTEVMAWVMARVTGRSFAQLLHERLWAPLGCEEDGYIIVDRAGMPAAGGGLNATLRDLARFGELIRREGEWNGSQLIPASVVHDIQQGDHPAKLPDGYSYRSQWWVPHNELGAIEARGLYGQRIYVAPEAEMVIARFASHPLGPADYNDVISVPQMLALGQMLRG